MSKRDHSKARLVPALPLWNRQTWSFITSAAVVGVIAVVFVFAAGPFAALELENGTLAGGANVVSVPGASGGKVVQFGAGGVATTPTPAPGGTTLNLPRIAWEGGPAYYNQFAKPTAAGWNNPNFFPIGVWYEAVNSQQDVDLDKAAGLNTYIELVSTSNMALVRNNGMFAMPSTPISGYGSETVGWLLNDEVDLWAHEGSAPWTGNYPGEGPICVPESALCGYTVLQTLRNNLPQNDGRPHYANFGFGLEFFIQDALAAKFLDYTEVSSLDTYWYTDDGMCSLGGVPQNMCHLSASYGWTLDRMRELDAKDGKLQPIYGFVEDGLPFGQFTTKIQPNQLAGAVMNSLIHEARGIIYFNHNFGGTCISQHVLRDSCGATIRPMVTTMNQRIKELAPVLNTQSFKYTFNPKLDTMLKQQGNSYYIFAMVGRGVAPGSYALTMPAGLSGATAEVMYENRSVPISGGQLTDSFAAESTYHIYKITP